MREEIKQGCSVSYDYSRTNYVENIHDICIIFVFRFISLTSTTTPARHDAIRNLA